MLPLAFSYTLKMSSYSTRSKRQKKANNGSTAGAKRLRTSKDQAENDARLQLVIPCRTNDIVVDSILPFKVEAKRAYQNVLDEMERIKQVNRYTIAENKCLRQENLMIRKDNNDLVQNNIQMRHKLDSQQRCLELYGIMTS